MKQSFPHVHVWVCVRVKHDTLISMRACTASLHCIEIVCNQIHPKIGFRAGGWAPPCYFDRTPHPPAWWCTTLLQIHQNGAELLKIAQNCYELRKIAPNGSELLVTRFIPKLVSGRVAGFPHDISTVPPHARLAVYHATPNPSELFRIA